MVGELNTDSYQQHQLDLEGFLNAVCSRFERRVHIWFEMSREAYDALGPEDFKDKLDAPVTPWFESWAREMGGSAGEKLRGVKKIIKSRFARSRINKMLLLTSVQFEGVLTEAGADAHWRPVAEDYLGAQFVRPSVPESAMLAACTSTDIAVPRVLTRDAKPNSKAATVAAAMSANEREKLGLPAAMMDVIMTPSPALNNISAPELSAATTEVCAAFFCEQGTLSMGAPLIRHYGRAMANWIVPPIEMKGNKRWEDPIVKSIAIKLGNWDRKDARVCGSLTPGHRMCVFFPAQHSDSNASLMYVVVQIMYRAGITIALADMSEKARANVADYPIFVVDEDAPAKYTRRLLLPGESKSSGGEQQAEGAALPTATTAPNLTGAPPVLAVTAAPVSTGGLLTIPKPPNFNGFPVAMATPLQNSSVQLVPPPAPPAVIFFEDDNAEPMNSGQMAHGAAVTHAQAAPTALSPGS